MPDVARRVLRVRGTVQGVGFRPFVFRVAVELGLRGFVLNDGDGVVIEAEGTPAALEALAERISKAPPPRAIVEGLEAEDLAPAGLGPFAIRPSDPRAPVSARVAPDLATCRLCLAELFDPEDRRHLYPFTNCTDCGPRYSIVREVPYDRARTTMAAFEMCAECRAEYEAPTSRRFHAEPNACPRCGPRLEVAGAAVADSLPDAPREEMPAAHGAPAHVAPAHGAPAHVAPQPDAIQPVLEALRAGRILALKGLGGFHLACDACDEAAVRRLRERKRRPHKPFAVMFPDILSLEREVVVEPAAREALVGARRPIVLLPRRFPSQLATGVAPGLRDLGVLLPYTPLHHLLLQRFGAPLVMTSGNLSEEPIAAGNDDARARLGRIADAFLLHDRDIHSRQDDSVVQVLLGEERLLRRARGHVPEAIALGCSGPELLAVGADLKNAFCLAANGAAILSPHIGDLESLESQELFREVRRNLEAMFQVRPRLAAHDLHPGYHSTALARATGLPLVAVQHHHAHVASCLADNGRHERVIGVAWDGTGYGTDGSVWGGELLVADLDGFERAGFIRPVLMAGGDAAVREPWRMALSHLMEAGLGVERVRHPSRAVVEGMLRSRFNSVETSSAGRLFDAVASLLGVRDEVSYEGQAAMELEALAAAGVARYALPLSDGWPFVLDPRPLLHAIVRDLEAGTPVAAIGWAFHAALADAIAAACARVRDRTGIDTAALSGGCFQSRLLTTLTHERLTAAGFEVLLHRRVPPNDGGIALGQAAIATWRHRTEA